MKYDLVVFDADGTLWDYPRAEAVAIEQAFLASDFEYRTPEHLELYRRINADIWRQFELGRIPAESLSRIRFGRLFDELGFDADPESFSEIYLEHLGRGAYLIDGAAEIVERLSDVTRLALLTNGLSQVQRARLSRTPFAPRFDEVIISQEVGSRKPEPAIFAELCGRFPDVAAARTLMVGDSLTSDIRGGIDAGMDTCWFNPAGLPPGPEIRPTWEIRDLRELIAVVDSSTGTSSAGRSGRAPRDSTPEIGRAYPG